MTKKRNPPIGISLNDFLKEEVVFEDAQATAIKRVLVRQLERAMKQHNFNKIQMAKRMDRSRAQLDRPLDPANESITFARLRRAPAVVGHKIRMELV